jgi:hypothetical protein
MRAVVCCKLHGYKSFTILFLVTKLDRDNRKYKTTRTLDTEQNKNNYLNNGQAYTVFPEKIISSALISHLDRIFKLILKYSETINHKGPLVEIIIAVIKLPAVKAVPSFFYKGRKARATIFIPLRSFRL